MFQELQPKNENIELWTVCTELPLCNGSNKKIRRIGDASPSNYTSTNRSWGLKKWQLQTVFFHFLFIFIDNSDVNRGNETYIPTSFYDRLQFLICGKQESMKMLEAEHNQKEGSKNLKSKSKNVKKPDFSPSVNLLFYYFLVHENS